MRLLSTLSNRIFFASSALAVVSIGVAIAIVNVRVTRDAEGELRRGLEEAGRLVDQHHRTRLEGALRMARLVADLPRLKAAVDLDDPPTVEPLARDYRGQVGSAALVVVHRSGRLLALAGEVDTAGRPPASLPGVADALAGRETTAFWPGPRGMLEVVTVPIFIGPEILGTLSVGSGFDDALARWFSGLTDSEIAFALDGRIQAATLPRADFARLQEVLPATGVSRVRLGEEDYLALTRPLAASAPSGAQAPTAMILRSRTKRLGFLGSLHTALAGTALVAVVLATLLSYAVARTVTRPLRSLTATMKEMAATGDLTRGTSLPPSGAWQDEDARLLTSTFSGMTESLARWQREAGRKERLASLGRLSTVIAHEVRNPLMIIKAATRVLRQAGAPAADRAEALRDIDGEVVRLNRLVGDVLDFARPLRFDFDSVDVNDVCRAAAGAALAGEERWRPRLRLDESLSPVETDRERLHTALVNVLTNARAALDARAESPAAATEAPKGEPDLEVVTERREADRVGIIVRDRGLGIPPEILPRVWEPYFTTRRGGTGIGLAIVRNVVEGLGGTIVIESRPPSGTVVDIELPPRPPDSARAGRPEGRA